MSLSTRPLTLRLAAFSVCALALALAGCGGGSGGSAAPGGSGQTQLGFAVVRFSGSAKPMLATSSGTVSVVGMTSTSSITNVNLNPTPNLASTSILFSRSLSGAAAAFSVPATGGAETPIVKSSYAVSSPTCSSLQLIAFILDGNIWTVHMDGTGMKQLTTGKSCFSPTFSPGGATIAYVFNASQIRTIPIMGGTPTTIFTAPPGTTLFNLGMSWSPDGTKIAFSVYDPSPNNFNIFTIPPSGGTATNVTPISSQSGSFVTPSWSPDSQNLAVTEADSGVVGRFALGGPFVIPQTPSGLNDSVPAISPDGTKIAFYRNSAGGATPGIYVSSFEGTDTTLLLADPPSTTGQSGSIFSLDWTPFLQQENFVGTSIAQLSPTPVTGFLLAQNGSQFASMFSFTATTPSTAAITTPVTNGSQPLLFTIAADSITNIAWTNVYSGAKTSQTLTGTPSMVVSIDSATGKVDFVAPALKPATSALTARKTVVYSGKFAAVYDNAGKNLAPAGASRIEVDPKSGTMVSVQ